MKIKKMIFAIVYERNTLSLIGNLTYAVFGFLSFILLTRALPQEEFGSYIIYVTMGSFIDLFRFGLTRNSIIRFLSGAKGEERLKILGSNVLIGIILIIIISILIYLTLFLWHDEIDRSSFQYFFYYYPILAISNLFWNNALSVLQSWQAFGRILLLRMVNIVSFVFFLIANAYFFHYGIVVIIWANIASNVFSSMLSLIKKWDGTNFLKYATQRNNKEIIDYGKYAAGTMIGSSLLRSADTFLIGIASIFGSVGVAKYAIPLKLTEVIEIPLRSFMATAFPKLSKANIEKNRSLWTEIFYSYGGAIELMFIPFMIVLYIFAQPIVLILGGDGYKDSLELMTSIFRIFVIYGLILPLDRITGVALDSIGKPDKNLWKVIFMASTNIIGDMIAIYWFQSLYGVALSTILNTVVGLFMGFYFLNKYEKMNYSQLWIQGIKFYKQLYIKVKDSIGR